MNLILTHENADFDAVASQLAAHKLSPQATPVLPLRQNRNVRLFLEKYGRDLPFVQFGDLPRKPVGAVTLVDCQHAQTVRGTGRNTAVRVIDHHAPREGLNPNWQVTLDPVGAATTLLVEQLDTQAVALSPVEATLMLLGIYEDSGSLTYGTTTARDVRAAAWLIEQGAMLDVVREFLRRALDDAQLKLEEQLIHSSQTLTFGAETILVAAASVEQPVEEIATVTQHLRDLLEPSAIFVLVLSEDHVHLVARETSDFVNVGAVAARFGGGGHSRAAAAIINDRSLDSVKSELLDLLPAMIQSGVTVADLMSHGVRTLRPDAHAREAFHKMRRYGYEGFPVVSEGRIVGLLTRRAVDRAMDHGLEDVRVDRLMEAGSAHVQPGDSLAALRQVMVASGWGQIPVTREDGKILGIVTRTDLVKHVGHPLVPPDRRAEISRLLQQALHPVLLALAREAGQMAEHMGFRLYVVGGVVRDLLLGLPIFDVDFVVEGDAIALTRVLSEKFGGQVRSHERFGTGKWLLTASLWREIGTSLGADLDASTLPLHLDFITARTEYYNAPTELPEVESSSIKHDLHRRDFTINTLAIRLDPTKFAYLLDFYSGEADLRSKRIRVLHSLSFVDDPTRILRAVRLEQRLGFKLDQRTEELLRHALPLLRKVSGDRIRHEIEFILSEPEPELALARLHELAVFEQLHPALKWSPAAGESFARLRRAALQPVWPELGGLDLGPAYLAVLTFGLPIDTIREVCGRLKLRRTTVQTLESLSQRAAGLTALDQRSMRPSQIAGLLDGADDYVLAAAWAVAAGGKARDRIADYARRLRHIHPVADGDVLLEKGLQPGPQFALILRRLREAWLDGEINTDEEEKKLLENLLRDRSPVIAEAT